MEISVVKKVLLGITGVCAIYLLWHLLFVNTTVWVNGAPVSGVWGGLAGGGFSLVASAVMLVLFLLMMLVFASLGLLVISAVIVLMSLWLFPVFAPVVVLILAIWMLKKASESD